ncbi:MAG: aminodeoxychorismate/anthranilate synthase component II [bacterium]|nr:aminodeoxychorismate/anthranilate synthase component II [bacterium]
MKTVILDNYDSFTYNLFQLVAQIQDGLEPAVVRHDALSVEQLMEMNADRIIISPGPGNPVHRQSMGICREVILRLGPTTPILGVCLGHLGIIEALGGIIERSPEPQHGKTSRIHHSGQGIFENLPTPFEAMRYHSLIGLEKNLPPDLQITARTQKGLIMAVQHKYWPLYGVQFHPESIGTPQGGHLVKHFLNYL